MKFNYSDDHGLIEEGLMRLENDVKKFISNISDPDIITKEAIRAGKAYDQILSYSRDFDISLIILATNSWSGKQNIMSGKVIEKVVRYSKTPVIVIRNNDLAAGKSFSSVVCDSLTQ